MQFYCVSSPWASSFSWKIVLDHPLLTQNEPTGTTERLHSWYSTKLGLISAHFSPKLVYTTRFSGWLRDVLQISSLPN